MIVSRSARSYYACSYDIMICILIWYCYCACIIFYLLFKSPPLYSLNFSLFYPCTADKAVLVKSMMLGDV